MTGEPSARGGAPPAVTPAAAKTYTVKTGDTLSGIAKAHLGNAAAYMRIFELNKDQLTDPEKIGAGAIAGAIVGGILGGESGAAKGAAIGGAAWTGVVLATRGEEVTLAKGTALAVSLASPLTVRVWAR